MILLVREQILFAAKICFRITYFCLGPVSFLSSPKLRQLVAIGLQRGTAQLVEIKLLNRRKWVILLHEMQTWWGFQTWLRQQSIRAARCIIKRRACALLQFVRGNLIYICLIARRLRIVGVVARRRQVLVHWVIVCPCFWSALQRTLLFNDLVRWFGLIFGTLPATGLSSFIACFLDLPWLGTNCWVVIN